MELIQKFFPKLSAEQLDKYARMEAFYGDWNSKINLISRKDFEHFYLHHVLHSLSIAKVIKFKPYTHIIDIGTGGGFPGIPLAIMFHQTQFYLIDSIGKKIKVVQAAIDEFDLKNVKTEQKRAEQVAGKVYDFAISRGVTKLKELYSWSKNLVIHTDEQYNTLYNGLLVLKGGDLTQEIKELNRKVQHYYIGEIFDGIDYFNEKYVIYLRM
ncbi:MAG: 16S rRNA (guanine(527)-N(7))-methyltransferase RsmG [Sphingobacteriales bacterium]|nr:MAG: 16S rRNA (guanine(527)-N(7))-methyltransferase RsmG [Sphingobacteriales bacterium]